MNAITKMYYLGLFRTMISEGVPASEIMMEIVNQLCALAHTARRSESSYWEARALRRCARNLTNGGTNGLLQYINSCFAD
jgi:hypothetical protein